MQCEDRASTSESTDAAGGGNPATSAQVLDWRGLVDRTLCNDAAAARELVAALYPLVTKIVRAYVPEVSVQEEWEQEVYLRVFSRLSQFRHDAPLEHWVSRLAVNVCVDALRARRRRPELRWSDLSIAEAEVVAQTAQLAATSEHAAAARELAIKLLETLAPEDRVIVQMLDMDGRSVAEIASLTGRSAAAVKVRAYRARRKLRAVLERLTDEARTT